MASEPLKIHATTRFGEDFELDRRAYQLRRSGRAIRLERIPMDLLFLLVDQRGELVTREQIVERIWGKGGFLDTDNAINGAVRKIRRVLNEDPDQPRFIETIPGKGYRFIAPVDATELGQAQVPSDPAGIQAGTVDRPDGKRWLVLAGLAIVLIVPAVWIVWSRSAAQRPPPGGKLMLAVLPFENLTGDPTQEYFSDGLTEEMISRLGNLDPQHLGVIARTSVARYKHTREPLDRVARDLGVHYVLEGSVRRSADRVRIAAQLIQVSDQTHLWARQYDRELSSLLAVQEEIAQTVARQIQISLADSQGGRLPAAGLSPASYEAYDLYLKGRYFWNKRTPEGFRQAAEHFQQAVEKDPAGPAPMRAWRIRTP